MYHLCGIASDLGRIDARFFRCSKRFLLLKVDLVPDYDCDGAVDLEESTARGSCVSTRMIHV